MMIYLMKGAMSSRAMMTLVVTTLIVSLQYTVAAPPNVTASHKSPHGKTTTAADAGTIAPITEEVPYVAAAVLKNCMIMPKDSEIPFKVKALLSSGAKLIRYHLQLSQYTEDIIADNSTLYKPLYWVRSTGRHGTGLLLLRHEYDILSLGSLGLGVEDLTIELEETPHHCLNTLSIDDLELLIRELVMNDFQNTTSSDIVKLQPTDKVCNMHAIDKDGTAEFRYMCCQRSEGYKITCNYLYKDFWLGILMVATSLLKILVILYSPVIVPDTYYRLKHVAAPYIHTLTGNASLMLNTVLTKTPEQYANVKTKFKLSKFRHMNNFKATIRDLLPDVPYSLTMDQICLRIKADRLLPEANSPVGILKVLYDSFVKCKIRERDAVASCCAADVLMNSNCKSRLSWYRLLKSLMQLLALSVLATPWILRVLIYFRFEHIEMEMRRQASLARGLNFYFPGSVTLYLTPLHVSFVIIYILLTMESCIYGVIKRQVKEKIKLVLRKCFRDMRERDRAEVIGWAVSLSLKPCTKFGVLGIILGLLYWAVVSPLLILILAFYLLPTLNLTVRLLTHFGVYLIPRGTWLTNNACCRRWGGFLTSIERYCRMETISSAESLEKNEKVLRSKSGRVQQLIIILLCLISLYSIIFLLTEFVSFAVELFVYTMMGVILNASMTLTYVSLFLLLGVYANDCFGYVSAKYLAFNKVMNSVILGLGNEKVEQTVYTMEDNQKNTAFRVRTERQSAIAAPVQLHRSDEGYPRWKVTRLALFLSKKDVPLIPKKIFFDACNMPFYAVPGELLFSYIRAAAEFGVIVLFLVFVLIVVLAFGDSYELSATNKLMATVAGGFMPLMLRKVVFKTHAPPTIDTSSINFQVCLNELLDRYVQTWPIFDMFVTSRKITDSCTSNGNGTTVGTEHAIKKGSCVNETDILTHDVTRTNGLPEIHASNDEIEPFISKATQDVNTIILMDNKQIDLLIDISEIDYDDFPGMMQPPTELNIGSTSFLDKTDIDMECKQAPTTAT